MSVTESDKAKGALALKWVRAVRAATNEFRSGLRALEQRPTERFEELDWVHVPADEDVLFEITKWLTDQVLRAASAVEEPPGSILGSKFDFSNTQLDVLLAIRDRTRSPVFNRGPTAAPLATGYIKHACKTINGLIPCSDQFTPEDRATFLAVSLAHRVHSGFAALAGRTHEVLELLRRYHPDKNGRRTPIGVPSKLSEDGILERLNDLAGRPLGNINAASIAATKERKKKRSEP